MNKQQASSLIQELTQIVLIFHGSPSHTGVLVFDHERADWTLRMLPPDHSDTAKDHVISSAAAAALVSSGEWKSETRAKLTIYTRVFKPSVNMRSTP